MQAGDDPDAHQSEKACNEVIGRPRVDQRHVSPEPNGRCQQAQAIKDLRQVIFRPMSPRHRLGTELQREGPILQDFLPGRVCDDIGLRANVLAELLELARERQRHFAGAVFVPSPVFVGADDVTWAGNVDDSNGHGWDLCSGSA